MRSEERRVEIPIVLLLHDELVDHGSQRLLAGVRDRYASEERVDRRILRQSVEVVEGKHIVEERAHAVFQAGAREHRVDQPLPAPGGLNVAARGRLQDLVIGAGVPQEKAQA